MDGRPAACWAGCGLGTGPRASQGCCGGTGGPAGGRGPRSLRKQQIEGGGAHRRVGGAALCLQGRWVCLLENLPPDGSRVGATPGGGTGSPGFRIWGVVSACRGTVQVVRRGQECPSDHQPLLSQRRSPGELLPSFSTLLTCACGDAALPRSHAGRDGCTLGSHSLDPSAPAPQVLGPGYPKSQSPSQLPSLQEQTPSLSE